MAFYEYAGIPISSNNTLSLQTLFVVTKELADSSGNNGPSVWAAYCTTSLTSALVIDENAVIADTEINAVIAALNRLI